MVDDLRYKFICVEDLKLPLQGSHNNFVVEKESIWILSNLKGHQDIQLLSPETTLDITKEMFDNHFILWVN